MCGIAGIWEGLMDESACGLVSSMTKKMAHRGPDAAGTYVGTNGVVGHRRLSIVDLQSGDQPITDESGKLAIVANGEIYNSMHNTNLQRVDRMTMVHSIEGRVPYLDVSLIELALGIPSEYKLYSTKRNSQTIEKWILRRACEDLLPPEILWRKKEQFDEGSGTIQLLEGALDLFSASREVPTNRNENVATRVRSTEEGVYHRLLTEAFTTPEIVLGNVVHWSDRPGQDEGTSPKGV